MLTRLTAREMQRDFIRMINLKVPNDAVRDIDSDTVFYAINVAYQRYIKIKYLDNLEQLKANPRELQKLYDDLRLIIKRETIENILAEDAEVENYYKFVNLPSDYLFYIRSDSFIKRTEVYSATDFWVPNRTITHEEISSVTITPFNKPIIRNPYILFEGSNRMYIYYDNETSLNKIRLTYVRTPKLLTIQTLDVDSNGNSTSPENAMYSSNNYTNVCELAAHTHQEILELAVNIFINEMVGTRPTQQQTQQQPQNEQ